MTKIMARDGYLFITPVPPGLDVELRFWEVVEITKPFSYRDGESGQMVFGTRRAGYSGNWTSLMTEANGVACFGRGLFRRVANFLQASGIPFTFEEDRSFYPSFHFGPDVVAGLRPEQMRVLMSILAELGVGQIGWQSDTARVPPRPGSFGALVSATMSTGKTVIIAALIRCFPETKIVVVTKKKSVIRRLVGGLQDYLPEISHEIGEFHGGRKNERRITVCSEALVDSFDTSLVGLLIHDEVHNGSGTQVSMGIMSYTRACKVGFSGTIDRHPKLKFLESQYGPVVDTISDAEAEELGRVSLVKVYVLKTKRGPDVSGMKEITLERHGITNNHQRNKLIGAVCQAIPENLQTVVFVRTIQHIEILVEKYLPPGFVVYHGQLKDKERAAIEKDLCDGKITRLIANDALSEGVDTTHVRVIVEAGYSATDQTVSQRGGRARRKADGKKMGVIITPSDDWTIDTDMDGVEKENPLKKKRISRVSNYSKRGWPVVKINEIHEINFSEINESEEEGAAKAE